MIAHQKKSYLKKYLVTFHPNVNTSEEAYNTRVVKSMSVFVDQCNQKCSDNVVLINEIEMKFRNFYSSNTCTLMLLFSVVNCIVYVIFICHHRCLSVY